MRSHTAAAVHLMTDAGIENARELADTLLVDWRTAPLSSRDRALYELIETVAQRPTEVDAALFDAARAEGWTDMELHHALTVSALFHFYNAWVDGSGAGLDCSGCEASGARLASSPYA